MTAAVIASVIAGSAPSSGTGGADSSGAAPSVVPASKAAPDRCPSARRAVRFYSHRIAEHRAKIGQERVATGMPSRTSATVGAKQSCPRYLARVLRRSARAWRLRAERHLTLRDYDVRPGYSGWRRAVDEVQKAYPGTKAWLLSCSASEGGWGRFVWNTQGSGCGGWLQYVPSTFVGFFARAEADVRRRGFRVPRSASSLYSPLGQALAGAWAYRNGLSFHWFGRGC